LVEHQTGILKKTSVAPYLRSLKRTVSSLIWGFRVNRISIGGCAVGGANLKNIIFLFPEDCWMTSSANLASVCRPFSELLGNKFWMVECTVGVESSSTKSTSSRLQASLGCPMKFQPFASLKSFALKHRMETSQLVI
jgi:hypothetical protein